MALLPVLNKMQNCKLVFKFWLLFKHVQAAFILPSLHFVLAVVVLGHVQCRMTFPEEWFTIVNFWMINQVSWLFFKLPINLFY